MAQYVIATLFENESEDFRKIVEDVYSHDSEISIVDFTHMSAKQACYYMKKGLIDTCMFSPDAIIENDNWRKIISYAMDSNINLTCAYNSSPSDMENAGKIGGLATSKKYKKPITHICKNHYELAVQSILGMKNNSTIQKEHSQEQMQKKDIETIDVLKTAFNKINTHDKYTNKHIKTMALISNTIGKKMNLSDEELEILTIGSLLHNIGKIDVSDDILQKKGRPTDEEWKELGQHVIFGEIRLNAFNLGPYERAKLVASQHHERYDGTGYPRKIKGDNIDILARIASVADAAQAMFGRAYAQAKTKGDLIAELQKCSGTQFDPKVASVLCEILNNPKESAILGLEYDNNGRIINYKVPDADELFPLNPNTRDKHTNTLPNEYDL